MSKEIRIMGIKITVSVEKTSKNDKRKPDPKPPLPNKAVPTDGKLP